MFQVMNSFTVVTMDRAIQGCYDRVVDLDK